MFIPSILSSKIIDWSFGWSPPTQTVSMRHRNKPMCLGSDSVELVNGWSHHFRLPEVWLPGWEEDTACTQWRRCAAHQCGRRCTQTDLKKDQVENMQKRHCLWPYKWPRIQPFKLHTSFLIFCTQDTSEGSDDIVGICL